MRQRNITVVASDWFWPDACFEETALPRIHGADPARIYSVGYRQLLRRHVDRQARGSRIANTQSNRARLTIDSKSTRSH